MTQICMQLWDQTHQGEKGGKNGKHVQKRIGFTGYPAETPQPQSNTVRPSSSGNAKYHGSVVSAQMITTDLAVTPKHIMSQGRSLLRCISADLQAFSKPENSQV